jgi:hypothetical protein
VENLEGLCEEELVYYEGVGVLEPVTVYVQDGRVQFASLSLREVTAEQAAALRTAEGIGAGSRSDEMQAAYGDALVTETNILGASGHWVRPASDRAIFFNLFEWADEDEVLQMAAGDLINHDFWFEVGEGPHCSGSIID